MMYEVWIDGPSYRGECGHRHRTLRGAVKCALKWLDRGIPATILDGEGREGTVEKIENYPLPPVYVVRWLDDDMDEEVEL